MVLRYQETFDGAKGWVLELKRRGDPDVVIALAGNKCDLDSERAVDEDVSDDSHGHVCNT